MTHTFQKILTTPSGSLSDSPTTLTGDSVFEVDTTVPANGGSANVVDLAIASADMVSLALLSTVPCVVTFTGDTGDNQTLVANVMTRLTSISSGITSLSIGANTVGSGPAGTIKIRALMNT